MLTSLKQFAVRLGLCLLVGVALGSLVVAPARSWLAGRFSQLAAEQPEQSRRVYRTLGALGDAAIEPLVDNATSQDPRVSLEARRALGAWLDVWRSRSQTDAGQEFVKKARYTLALLSERVPVLTESGGQWAERFASQVLDATDEVRFDARPRLIAAADRLLEELGSTRLLPDPPPVEAEVIAESGQNELDKAVEAFPLPPKTDPVSKPVMPKALSIAPPPVVAPVAPADELAVVEPNKIVESVPAEPRLDWRPAEIEGQPAPLIAEDARPIEEAAPPDYRVLSDRELLAELVANAEAYQASRRLSAQGPGAPSPEDELQESQKERLQALADALAERGYRGLRLTDAQALLSPEESVRIRLIDQLFSKQSGDAARLLLLLARDESAEVRLAAISALGSSPHRQLVEAAWSLALKDEDPRVGRLTD